MAKSPYDQVSSGLPAAWTGPKVTVLLDLGRRVCGRALASPARRRPLHQGEEGKPPVPRPGQGSSGRGGQAACSREHHHVDRPATVPCFISAPPRGAFPSSLLRL